MKLDINSIFRGIFNIYLRIAIRFYEIFPKRWQPSGLGIFSFCIGIDIIVGFDCLRIINIIDNKHNDLVFTVSMLSILISGFFLIFYFNNRLDEFLEAENEKGDRYIRYWRTIAWIYLIISTLPLIQWFIEENLS